MITEPTVLCIGGPVLRGDFFLSVKRHDGMENYQDGKILQGSAGDMLVEHGGRVCYDSFKNPRPGGSKAYHDHLKEVGHFSTHEHATFVFLVSGVSRSLTHEWIRHRHLSPSQESQRFVDENDLEYVMPPLYLEIADDNEAVKMLAEMLDFVTDTAESAYINLVKMVDEKVASKYPSISGTTKRKLIREAARSVLPNMTSTEIQMTGNARAWRHFLHLRGSQHADAEIRRLALAIAKVLKRETTFLFDDIEEVEIANRPGEYELTGTWEKE